jgi:hypothetical protein
MTDHRTLRLAQLEVTPARVEALVKYQRSVAAHLAEPGHEAWAGRIAFAHGAGLKDSGLDAQDARKLSAVAADYCGRRWQSKRLEARLADARARAAEGKATPKDTALLTKIPGELVRLADFSAFTSLHGEGALTAISAREDVLLELHERLAHLEGEGHLHRAPGIQ